MADQTTKTHVFQKRSMIRTTLQEMIAFHQSKNALARLTPFPIFVQFHRDERISLTEGRLEVTLWFGPVPVRWTGRHEPGPIESSFADTMLEGPLAYWRHEHIFEETPEGIILTDRIALAHKPGLKGMLTRLVFGNLSLRMLFFYRHMRTRHTVSRKS